MNQISFDDIEREQALKHLPAYTAFIDECGNFGFDFDSKGVSKFYILCAIVVKNSELNELHKNVLTVKANNGFQNTEMKSSAIGNNYKRRNKIISELLPIKFRAVLLVANKQAFYKESPLTTYRQSFIKFLHQRLYNLLYASYPKLHIIEDQIGSSEFQESFKSYVSSRRSPNLFNEYDFDYSNSKDSLLVQLADIIGGTIGKVYEDTNAPNYLEMLNGKIIATDYFPALSSPYLGTATKVDKKYDKEIFDLSMHCARSFIDKYKDDDNLERRLQVATLKYLIFQVCEVDAYRFISSKQILEVLEEYASEKIRPNYLYRRIIAPLRDAKVILASDRKGYKIPISAEDITTYINQTLTVVSPMLHRVGICRNLIQLRTENAFDVLDDPAFLTYKKYFD